MAWRSVINPMPGTVFAPQRVVKKLFLTLLFTQLILLPIQTGHAVFTPSKLSRPDFCDGEFALDPFKQIAEQVVGNNPHVGTSKARMLRAGQYITSRHVAHLSPEQKYALLERLLLQMEILSKLTLNENRWTATRFEIAIDGRVELVGFVGEIGPALYLDRNGTLYYGIFDDGEAIRVRRLFEFDFQRNTNYLPKRLNNLFNNKFKTHQDVLDFFLQTIKTKEFPAEGI